MPRISNSSSLPPRMHVTRPHGKRRAKWRRLGVRSAIAVVFFGMLVGYVTGKFDRFDTKIATRFYSTTADLGFRVTDVALEGRQFTPREDVLAALGIREGDPILAFDPEQARAALESLPRIASAEVERRLPGTIAIRLTERMPMAIWQHNGRMVLIDHDGIVLSNKQIADYASLPMIVGEDAAKPAAAILEAVENEPDLARRVTAFIRVGGRRWDLRLDNNIEIKLPETGTEAAVHRLAAIQSQSGLFERDVVAVDLRLPGRMVVETSQPRDTKHKPAPQQGI